MNEERVTEILYHIFNCGKTEKEVFNTFYEKETIYENCYVCEYLRDSMIPMARETSRNQEEYFLYVSKILQKVIWEKLGVSKGLYTLKETGENGENDRLLIKDKGMYVLYTNEHRKELQYELECLENRDKIIVVAMINKLDKVMVTDGKEVQAIIHFKEIFEG